ncbi:MAG: hypothetical protein K0S34_1172 [Bacillales bacterium]|jgi:hypothetical protein|nr:hypothetical protein [Bacillales bacterium]
MIFFNEFIKVSPVKQDLLQNQDAIKAFEFIKSPASIVNMIVFSKSSLPVVSGIAKDLEIILDRSSFPMSDRNNRIIVGRMIRYILDYYGYTPLNNATVDKRLRNFSDARYFKTSAVYTKSHQAKLRVELVIRQIEGDLE